MTHHSILARVATARSMLANLIASTQTHYLKDLLRDIDATLAPIPAPRSSWWRRLFRRTPVQRAVAP